MALEPDASATSNSKDKGSSNDKSGSSSSSSNNHSGGGGGVILEDTAEMIQESSENIKTNDNRVSKSHGDSGWQNNKDTKVAAYANDLLPTTVTPTRYDIHLRPDIESGKVTGSVMIVATVNNATQHIVLHAAASLSISSVTVRSGLAVAASVTDKDISYDAHLEMASIRLPHVLASGTSIGITIGFVGKLGDGMNGLYRCKYRNRAGELASMLVTQFQAKSARMAFPCWDEPAIKARFTLSLTVPESHTALSNMPVVDTVSLDGGGLKTVYFDETPVMSTYLLAIVSGELDYVEGISYGGPLLAAGEDGEQRKRQPVVCRIYTAPADIDKVKFSLDTAVHVLELLADMFDYEYPLPKLDLVAIPELEAGGMENWGLILFRTVRLFITAKTSLWIRQKAVYVIAHELSHQWFGNLVTMAWWDDLWLNEGFATWIGIHVTDGLYPEWRRWDHFAIEDRQAALSADSLRSSHPIQVSIKGSADIDQVFDSITYYKGCSLIRMLSAHLGIDAFMAGVRAYLVAHEYGTATTADLWRALEKASGEDVATLMCSWITKIGYPVISVDADFATGRLVLRQNRYLHSGRPLSPDEDSVVWWVPLGMISADINNGRRSRAIMHQRQETLDIPHSVRWIKLNHANAGLYRVCYSPEALQRLARAMEHGELQTGDVVGILNDTVALVVSGYVRTSTLLDMLGSFTKAAGDSYVVWQIIGAFLENMNQTWADRASPAECVQIVRLARSLFGPKAAALGWAHRTDDGPLVARLRAISIPRAGWAGDPSVVAQACQLFDELYSHPDESDCRPFHHDFTASVLEIAVRSGPRSNYARVREMYEHSQRWHLSEDQRMAALGAMACAPADDMKMETLEYAMSDKVLPQDLNIVIGYMVTSAAADTGNRQVLWRWFSANYQRVVARLGESSALLGHVVSAVIGNFSTNTMADCIEAWFCDKRTAAFDRMLPQSLEFVRVRAAWYDRDSADVAQWLLSASVV
ncbi:hypothetical protein IW140_003841 [Coemansia sp. RSA 1813]|nr:hypothetical protein EV178_005804 [Coemansia sp. RSA 1646]KAJ1765374.1 hypothetical protein LPJ74_006378 [Coemansia sp. RSA 1843]KAJ2086398.1 hypothetical protein IW138_005726 [Coemansia sp. RSA 986]KAJ2215669.1 hypothetical protein EV179_001893 [Coemansia sp. RSA 487]KAJ2568413.1 hypothetical protein IW140_003841 [Coemansia sp. RSA 1813]